MSVPTLTIGRMTVAALQDAPLRAPPAAIFPDVPAAAWDAFRHLLDGEGFLLFNIGSYLVRTPERTVLVDTGIGGRERRGFPIGTLPESLRAAGLRPEEVDLVIHTHLHLDHTGWNTVDADGQPTPLFPNARYVVQRADWEHFSRPEAAAANPHIAETVLPLERLAMLETVEGECTLAPGITGIPTPGHTPGHMSLLLAHGSERAFIIGDVAHTPAQLTETAWSPTVDQNPAEARESRRRLVERMAADGGYVLGGHFPAPGFGRLVRRDGVVHWEPLRME